MTTTEFTKFSSLTKPERVVNIPCTKCGGQGGWRGWPGFTCFRCGGSCIDPTQHDLGFPAAWSDAECQAYLDKREARREAARDKKAAKAAAEHAAAYEANVDAEPQLARIIEAAREDDDRDFDDRQLSSFTLDVALKGQFHVLSARQIETLLAAYDRDVQRIASKAQAAAEYAEAAPLEAGRRELHGKVISTKTVESNFGRTFKMLVELDDGCRVFGTVPAAIDFPPEGRTLTFTATVEPSKDDHRFGFFSRPTKVTAEPEGKDE